MNVFSSSHKAIRLACAFLFAAVLAVACVGVAPNVAHAEGSKDLTENGGYRAYTERYGSSTAGQSRLTEIQVYAQEGETIYFGTSVRNAQLNFSNDRMGTNLSATELANLNNTDIIMCLPGWYTSQHSANPTNSHAYPYINGQRDANVQLYQVDNNVAVGGRTAGYIGSRAVEVAGPALPGNSSGYDPFSYTVPSGGTGVYTFKFCSAAMTSENPKPVEVNSDVAFDTGQKGGAVAAWDVTVVRGQNIIEGRVFTEELFLNMGGSMVGSTNPGRGNALRAKVYPITNDGYRYEVDFNGMDPFGFVFFANNRGLLINKEGLSSLYHSVKSNNNQLSDLASHNIVLNNIPTETQIDQTYRIFFNDPEANTDMLNYFNIPSVTGAVGDAISDFTFKGTTLSGVFKQLSDNEGYVGQGGKFSFTTPTNTEATSYEITLTFDTDNVVTLANALAPKGQMNEITWDGRDARGNVVPAGTYGTGKVGVQLKGGEVHFPLMDVEQNLNGIIIKRLNGLGSETDKATVYYNNSLNNAGSMDNGWSTVNWSVADGMDASSGVSSISGALKFTNADQTALDVWAHYSSSADIGTGYQFSLIDLKDFSVTKRWLNDAEADRPASLDVELWDITPAATPARIATTTLTAADGWAHTWTGLDASRSYEVREPNVPTGYTAEPSTTTNTSTTLFNTLTNNSVSRIVVIKEWVDEQGNTLGADVTRPSVDVSVTPTTPSLTVTLDSSNGWTTTFENLPTGVHYRVDETLNNPNFVLSDKEVTVTEDSPGIFTMTVTFKNTYIPPTTSVSIEKNWKDIPADFNGTIPAVTMHLLQDGIETFNDADGNPVSSKSLAPSANYTASVTWDNLPKTDAQGKAYTYTTYEDVPYGYVSTKATETTVNGLKDTYTNSFIPVSTVSAIKEWNPDATTGELQVPASLTVQLYNGEVPVGDVVTLSGDTYWEHTWNQLMPSDTYVVKELGVGSEFVPDSANDEAATRRTVQAPDGTNEIFVYDKTLVNAYQSKQTNDPPGNPKGDGDGTTPKGDGSTSAGGSALAHTGDGFPVGGYVGVGVVALVALLVARKRLKSIR